MTSANWPQQPLTGAAGVGCADAAAAVEWLAVDPRALLQLRADGTLRWANAAAGRLLQHAAVVGEQRSPVGRPLSVLLGLQADDAAQLQRALATGATALVSARHAAADAASLQLHVDAGPLAGDVQLLVLTAVAPSSARSGSDGGAPVGPSYAEVASQLGLAVQLARIAVWRHDLTTDRLYFNDLASSVLDIQPDPEGVPVQALRELIHPLDLPTAKRAFEDALVSGRPTDVELRHRRRDGSWRTLMTRRVAQAGTAGRPAALIGVALDVSDRVDESRRAAELGRRFELATRAGGIGYWSIDGSTGPPHWSDQLRAIHGLAPGAAAPLLADWLALHLHADDRAAIRRRLADWTRSGRPSLDAEFRVVRTDGEVRFLVTHSRVDGVGASRLLFGLVIDVTERRNVELALRQAGERAALAARGAGIGTWEVDLLDGSAFWDDQMWRLRGLTPLLLPPSATERMALVHPDDRAAVQQQIDDSYDEEAPANHEFRVLLPGGSVRWLASRSATVRDAQGRLARRIGVNWDITDSRTADAVRHEREIALRENQAKSKFLARMSHELRTPLNAVLGFAQLLLADDGGTDAAAATRRQRALHISAAGQHLLELIDDVLDLSALDGGEKRLQLQPVSLAAVVAGTLPLLQPLLRGRNVVVETGPLDAVVVLADATRLRQVLLNLLSNAIKYNRDGGRVLLSATHDGRDGSVEIGIADTGRGLSAEQLRHLFEPFNRLGAERSSIEGNGIGLAIVKTLVQRMGGSMQVSSTPAVGSVFALRLADGSPASAAGQSPTTTTTHAAAAQPAARHEGAGAATARRGTPLRQRTLLYVEDNPVNALIISELIARRADVQLHIAVDGVSGVETAASLQPDLVLLDMQLPDIDGHEVLRRLRSQTCTAGIPVIALSANAMPDDIDRALRAGFSDYWTKPLDYRTFLGSIDALFGPAA